MPDSLIHLKFLWLFSAACGMVTGAFGLTCYQQPVQFFAILFACGVVGHAIDCIIAKLKKD